MAKRRRWLVGDRVEVDGYGPGVVRRLVHGGGGAWVAMPGRKPEVWAADCKLRLVRVRTAMGGDAGRVHDALIYLRQARDLLRAAGASHRTVNRVRAAIASVGGVQRHLSTRVRVAIDHGTLARGAVSVLLTNPARDGDERLRGV